MKFRFFDVRGKFMEKLEPDLIRLGMQIIRPVGRGYIIRVPDQAGLDTTIGRLDSKFVRTSVREVDNYNDRFTKSKFMRIFSVKRNKSVVTLSTSLGDLTYDNVPDHVDLKVEKLISAGKFYEAIAMFKDFDHASI